MHVFSETLNILKAALPKYELRPCELPKFPLIHSEIYVFQSFIISDMPLDIGLVYLAWWTPC